MDIINNAGMGDENLFHKAGLQKLEDIIELNIKSVVSFKINYGEGNLILILDF